MNGFDPRVVLNSPQMISLRHEIRLGHREECKTCVCSMYRGARSFIFNQ